VDAVLGGMINGLMTLSGAWTSCAPIPASHDVVSVAFYGMSTFEGPLMSVKAVNSLSHYTDWASAMCIREVSAGRLRLLRPLYCLIRDLEQEALLAEAG